MRRMLTMLRNLRGTLSLLAVLGVLAASCERRPLEDLSNTHYVRVYVNEDILNVTQGFYNPEYARPAYDSPQIMRIVLADPQTGLTRADRYLRTIGHDERGTYYEGYVIADPGEYDVFAYNFDTEVTLINHPNDFSNAFAYTNEIASHLRTRLYSRFLTKAPAPDDKIVYDADNLFVARSRGVQVPYSNKIDTLRTVQGDYFEAESLVKYYYLQVRVKNIRYAISASSLLDGMSGSAQLSSGLMNEDDPVTVYFEMIPGGESPAAGISPVKGDSTAGSTDDMVIIYTTFGTFGKIPSLESNLSITFDFTTVYGQPYFETFDITDLFLTEDAIVRQWLLIDKTIVIPDPPKGSSGGFRPGVDEWGDVYTDIII